MQITVQVRDDPAHDLHDRQATTPPIQKLLEKANELGIVLEPMHPQAADPRLATYFTAQVPDRATAEQVIRDLRQFDAVAAAYVKPPDRSTLAERNRHAGSQTTQQ